MLFRVQNLGPLRDAQVDLSKDIIVLAGPNNAGKTYLAWSVYGLYRMRPRVDLDLSRWVTQLLDSPDHSIDIAEFLAADGDKLLASIAKQTQDNLHLCFAAEESRFAGTRITIEQVEVSDLSWFSDSLSMQPTSDHWFVSIRHDGRMTWLSLPGTEMTRIEIGDLNSLINEGYRSSELHKITTTFVAALSAEERHSVEATIHRGFFGARAGQLFAESTLFPAERIAVNIFAKELALQRTKLVDEMVDADLDGRVNAPLDLVRRKAGRYPWPIRDSLRTANDLANLKKEKSPFADLADELESRVLRGNMSVAESGELRFSPNDNENAQLEMHLTASVVKSLSSVVFYFRHLAQKRDFIIIDEPELNLHPDNQRIVTRILAKAARRGIKIMMSTHSDYVLRELNHLVMLSQLPEEEAKAWGYDPLTSISRERLGVYLFKDQTAEAVPVEETGFSITTIDDVVNQLNADEQRLYARLFGE